MTAIEWTDRTWNPTTGCDRISPGCDHCYALTMAARLKKMGQAKYQNDGDPRTSGPGFAVTTHPDTLDAPLHWRKPAKVFVNSMSDLFHPDVPVEFLWQVFGVMAAADRHQFQILTKRPQRMASLIQQDTSFINDVATAAFWWSGENAALVDAIESEKAWPLPNVWLGTSIESDRYTFRADHLRCTAAAVRFLSLEPLLGPLPSLDLTGIDWVIVGGESGRSARLMDPRWARDIRDRCVSAGIPFLFKQWGEWAPVLDLWDGQQHMHTVIDRLGKKRAGRVLDGRTWDEYPL